MTPRQYFNVFEIATAAGLTVYQVNETLCGVNERLGPADRYDPRHIPAFLLIEAIITEAGHFKGITKNMPEHIKELLMETDEKWDPNSGEGQTVAGGAIVLIIFFSAVCIIGTIVAVTILALPH